MMKKIAHSSLRLNLIRILSQSVFVGVIATASLFSSVWILNSKAYAQSPSTVSASEVTNYAKTMLTMEPLRQQAFDEIKKMIGSKDVPQIVCNDKNSFNNLPNKAKDIAVNYCQRYQEVVTDNGLTIIRFNQITLEIQNNEDLKRQIYNTLLRLQKNSKS
jgi:glutaredoxin